MKLSGITVISLEEKEKFEEKRKLNAAIPGILTNIIISATFTAEPLEEFIKWWCKKFNVNAEVRFAPYNQVFQELLDPASLLSTNDGISFLLVRFEDLIRDDNATDNEKLQKLERYCEDLTKTLQNHKSPAPVFIGTFPIAAHLLVSDTLVTGLTSINRQWQETIQKMGQVKIITFNDLADLYNIRQIFDPVKDRIGHLPFSDEYFAAVGAGIARTVCSLVKPAFKVIVLDCDNTLWRGVSGEQRRRLDSWHLYKIIQFGKSKQKTGLEITE